VLEFVNNDYSHYANILYVYILNFRISSNLQLLNWELLINFAKYDRNKSLDFNSFDGPDVCFSRISSAFCTKIA
jgi:hypothetical protein